MKYVVVVEVPEDLLDGDDSIEVACREVNEILYRGAQTYSRVVTVSPLSEMIAC